MHYLPEAFAEKSSPLSKLWIAGTILKKMSKKAIMSSRIEKLCKDLSDHSVPIALPVRARLILGLARIHDKQVHYLYMEAIKSQADIQNQSCKAKVNLPSAKQQARADQITVDLKIEHVFSANDQWMELDEVFDLSSKLEVDNTQIPRGFDVSEIELPMSKIQDPTIAMPTEIDLDYSFWDDLALPSIPMDMLDLSGIRNDMEDTKNSEEIEFNFDEQGMQLDDDKTLNTIFENEAIVEHSSSPNSPNQSTPSTSEFRAHIKRRRAKVDRIESVDYETQIPSERLMLLLQNTTRLIVERPLIDFVHAPTSLNKLSRETIEESLSKASYPNLCVELLSEFREFLKPRSLNSLKPKKRRTERGSFEYNDEVQWMPEQGRAGLLETGALENDFEIPRAQDEIEYQSDIDMFSNQESLTFLGREIGSEIGSLNSSRRNSMSSRKRFLDRKEMSPINNDVIGALDFEISIGQLPIPEIQIEDEEAMETKLELVTPATRLFAAVLHDEFLKIENRIHDQDSSSDISVSFDEVLTNAVPSKPSRHDAALAFFQTLVLHNMDVISVYQEYAFEDIIIAPGPRFLQPFSREN